MTTINYKVWAEFYQELANKILNYKNDVGALIEIIKHVYKEIDIKLPTLENNNNNITDIDPFTVFGLFNKGITDQNRTIIITEFAKQFDISLEVPNEFAGIPVLNNMSATFYYFEGNRGENDIRNLWEVFEKAIKYAAEPSEENKNSLIHYYDIVSVQKGVKWNLTMGLFWIRPYTYLNLDRQNRSFLSNSENGMGEVLSIFPKLAKDSVPNGQQYIEISNKCKSLIDTGNFEFKNLPEMSHSSWVNKPDNGADEERLSKISYAWFVGAVHGKVDKAEDFIQKNIWENGYDDKYFDIVNSVKVGDKIAIKATYTQKNDISFKTTDEVVSVMSIKAIGTVTKNYQNGKLLDVNWTRLIPFKIWYFFTGRNTIWRVEEKVDDWMYKALIDFTFNNTPQDIPNFLANPYWKGKYVDSGIDNVVANAAEKYTKNDFLNEVYINEESYTILINLLNRKKNIILQGAPGVGKTYAATRLAYSLLGEKDTSRVQLIQFHQSYSYEDFIMGYRPEKEGFNLVTGVFYDFCKKAQDDDENDYYFIIDEINRGNISKIFGELFMLIEHDKRDEINSIRLLYADEQFYIPSNVHIIGMMNTADRSLAMLDYALRRRFAFFEMIPAFDSDGFKSYQTKIAHNKFDTLISEIIKLNNYIEQDESLGAGFRIGYSYFIKTKEEIIDDTWLKTVVNYEIIPLLQEYWFDEPSKVNEWSDRLKGAI